MSVVSYSLTDERAANEVFNRKKSNTHAFGKITTRFMFWSAGLFGGLNLDLQSPFLGLTIWPHSHLLVTILTEYPLGRDLCYTLMAP